MKNHDELEKLTQRIGECEVVVNELSESTLWKIIVRDLEQEQKELDNNWQQIWDTDKLLAARVIKFATKHILDLKDKYSEELKHLKKEIRTAQNPDKEIRRDWDHA